MRILATGCTGFAGGYLIEELYGQGSRDIFGISRRSINVSRPDHLAGKLTNLLQCDLADRRAVGTVLREVRPDQIFHLAGYAQVGRSFQEADAAWEANLTATRNLYEAVIAWGGRPRILYVSSGLVHGEPETVDPMIAETCPLLPVSPYAASKAAADLASFQYTRSAELEIIRVRPFNHIGPRQSPEFAVSNFARQIAAIEQGKQPPVLQTGDLNARRDLTDVRDMVHAYALLMEHGVRGEVYNSGTGEAHSMQEVLDRLLGMTRTPIKVRQEAKLLRAKDIAALRADAAKLRQATGWAPRYSLDQTLSDILEYWRSAVGRET
jgi:GDP-4-dehydro-6-deoxy-D-mannose reductase